MVRAYFKIKPVVKCGAWIFILIATAGCAEKKARLWIEPPVGYGDIKSGRELSYKIEDVESGKKESLSIPLSSLPQNLVVDDQRHPNRDEGDLPPATHADRLFNEKKVGGTVPAGTTPTISYFRGIAEVESLYRKQQFSEALIRLAPLVEQYPAQPRLYVMQGTLYRKLGEKKMAFIAFKKAHDLNPDPKVEDAMLKAGDELDAAGGGAR